MRRRVVVTAGPTREYVDPVRYLGNESSGKMGFEIARAAREAGGARRATPLPRAPVEIRARFDRQVVGRARCADAAGEVRPAREVDQLVAVAEPDAVVDGGPDGHNRRAVDHRFEILRMGAGDQRARDAGDECRPHGCAPLETVGRWCVRRPTEYPLFMVAGALGRPKVNLETWGAKRTAPAPVSGGWFKPVGFVGVD